MYLSYYTWLQILHKTVENYLYQSDVNTLRTCHGLMQLLHYVSLPSSLNSVMQSCKLHPLLLACVFIC